MLEVPFTSGLARHVDPDWLLRAARRPGVCLELEGGPEPQVVWHVEREPIAHHDAAGLGRLLRLVPREPSAVLAARVRSVRSARRRLERGGAGAVARVPDASAGGVCPRASGVRRRLCHTSRTSSCPLSVQRRLALLYARFRARVP